MVTRAALLLLICVGLSSCLGSWQQGQGSWSRNATMGVLGGFISGANVSWRVSAPYSGHYYGSPVIDDLNHQIIIAGADGYLYAHDQNTGSRRWRICIGSHGTFPSSPCTGFNFPDGVSSQDSSFYFYPNLVPMDSSIILTVQLANQPAEPPYGYNDRRAVILRLNATTGQIIWNLTSGNFDPQNGDSASIPQRPLILPDGNIIFWQLTSGHPHLVKLDYQTGNVIFNITGSAGFNFSFTDDLTYIEDDDSIWTNAQQVGGICKLSAATGKLIFHFPDNVLDSMSMPCPMSYDSRTKVVHFGRTGWNQCFALNAITGEPLWQIPAFEAGWPTASVLCSKNQVVWFSDDALLAAWDEQAAENQKPIWQVSVIDPPPPNRQVVASTDGYVIVSYATAIWFFDCTGALLWKENFADGGRSPVNSGPALGNNVIYWNAGGELIKLEPNVN